MCKRFFRKVIISKFLIGIGLFFILSVPLATVALVDITAPGHDAGGRAPLSLPMVAVKQTLDTTASTPTVAAPAAGAASKTMDTVQENVVNPLVGALITQTVWDVVSYGLDQLAYYSAVWLANGGSGQESLFYPGDGDSAWKNLGNDLLGELVGSLSQNLNGMYDTKFSLCSPPDFIRFGLALGISGSYQPREPKCDWQSITQNTEAWLQGLQEKVESFDKSINNDPTAAAMNALALGLRPGQTSLSYLTIANTKIMDEHMETKGGLFAWLVGNTGFKGVTDPVTGQVKTPASFVKVQVEEAMKAPDDMRKQMLLKAAFDKDNFVISGFRVLTVFLDTLVSEYYKKLMLGLLPDEILDFDPFNETSSSSASDRQTVEQFYASLISTTKLSLDNYSAISEFAVCPAISGNRQINNCVIDTSFLQILSRGGSSEFLTVATAMEQGYLNGDWPLYSPDDVSHNQDSFCYTYGYCYGNLVKLRKARIIPIGWELAAASDSNSTTTPVTLQEVVEGFNDCNSDGQLDADHPWCHLIDPNWVLKYPSQQCLASMIGEQTVSSTSIAARSGTCVDAPSCVSEGEDGSCQGYGYCVREKNTWDFQGEACPEEYATCLSFSNTDTDETGSWLFNTLDEDSCSADNAGCLWYRSNKYLDDAGTPDDESDDEYVWSPGDDVYLPSEHDNDLLYYSSAGVATSRQDYGYDTGDDGVHDFTYSNYSFEDRIYLNAAAEECTESDVGCSALYSTSDGLSLNILRNSSFEEDDDGDGVADFWTITGAETTYDYDNEGANSSHLTDSYYLNGATLKQENIPLQPNRFYTLSIYAQKGTGSSGSASLSLALTASNNTTVSLVGYSSEGCSISGSTVSLAVSGLSSEAKRFDCTFTAPALIDSRLYLIGDFTIGSTSDLYVDAVQLEAGGSLTDFHEDYNESDPSTEYLRLPPVWLGCEGEETDPADCDNYAQICSSTEVGCTLYSPEDGDPGVPAVLSGGDQCPEECAGYATFKQEATDYDNEEFPLYFIADTAKACNSSDVGCDEFTNLETEEIEAFSYLRACVLPQIDSGSVYFTWQGSDTAGYQLVSYQILESDLSDSGTLTFDDSSETEAAIGHAPCTNWQLTSENVLSCKDTQATIEAESSCDEHDDLIDNPDCREFYDVNGDIHYRLYSETISISEDCTAYRKTNTEEGDCDDSGGFWTDSGECRYLIEPSESTACSSEAAGCREYTGGSSRNASTVLEEQFELGTYEDYETVGSASLSISNESIAVDGHSLRIATSALGAGFETLQDYYNSDKTTTCSAAAGCASVNSLCTVENGEESCGTLTDQLVEEKTYVLKFWAKGSVNIGVALTEQGSSGTIRDLVDPDRTTAPAAKSSLTALALSGSWQLYELGPLDTSDLANFDDNAVLGFYVLGSSTNTIYIDNIQLVQTEEDLTLIKDSWVTPSTCDQTSSGADAPQYYLGCEEYTDQDESVYYIYQFDQLCSEEAVGCQAFYNTFSSASSYTQVFNASCYYDKDAGGDFAYLATDPSSEDIVTAATACTLSGEEVCTIQVGYNNCQFDYDGNLPSPLPTNIVLGPEAVVVLADQVGYYVSSDNFTCSSSVAGCTEYGQPTFSSDQTAVTEFESVYLLNQPDNYADQFCSHGSLFCAEWSSTEDGNFYFKNPGEKSCEYKTGISIGNATFDGWFRTGTNEFCYGVSGDAGYCSENSSTACDQDSDCVLAGVGECVIDTGSYIIGGDFSGIWLDGDEAYGGWAGSCDSNYDLCAEFVEPLDTREGQNPEGASYFYLDNESLDEEESTTSTERCDGSVSLEKGCALFFDTMDQDYTYNSAASYLISEHADVFFGEDPQSLEEPVSCDDTDETLYTLTTGESVNVCFQRCTYEVIEGNEITNLSVLSGQRAEFLGGTRIYFGNACLDDSDCQTGIDSYGQEVAGTCFNLDTDGDNDVTSETFDSNGDGIDEVTTDLSSYILTNDTNRVIKVNRDRECAQWLSCSSSHAAWDDRENKWINVCEDVNLCDEYSISGTGGGTCSEYLEEEPIVLDESRYSARDVSWYGLEYSSYAIPNQLPVEYYEQVDLMADGYCVNASGDITSSGDEYYLYSCSSDDDCTTTTAPNCADIDDLQDWLGTAINEENYLAYAAGSCSGGTEGSSCTIGFCTDSGKACSDDDECQTGECIVGYCQASVPDSFCTANSECNEAGGFVCENSECTYIILEGTSQKTCTTVTDCGSYDADGDGDSDSACVPGALAKTGSCYNNTCLVGLDGQPLDPNSGEEMSCRGYPESMSPFPPEVVEEWLDPEDLKGGVSSSDTLSSDEITDAENQMEVIPYTFVSGFNDANVCSPSYKKVGECVAGGEDCLSDEDCASWDTCEFSLEVTDDCDCSYDKVQYGDNSGIERYYPLGTSVDNVLAGICSGGAITGAGCENDAGCNPNDTDGYTNGLEGDGICQFVNHKDSIYGWDGYCLERDISVQLYGSSSSNSHPCLTWLPVDQLRGARDAYANDTDAGFDATQNYYYCTEVAYYADLYPTGIEIDSDTGEITDMDYACATSNDEHDGNLCNYGDYGTNGYEETDGWSEPDISFFCAENVKCPTGYVAIVGVCDQDTDPESSQVEEEAYLFDADEDSLMPVCFDETDGSGSDVTTKISDDNADVGDDTEDCPFFCIPHGSYHMSGNDFGTLCLEDLEEEYDSGFSDYDTTYYRAYDLFNYDEARWSDDNGDGNAESDKTKFMDCVKRGVPVGFGEYGTNPYYDENWDGLINNYFYRIHSSGRGSYGVTYREIGGRLGTCEYGDGDVCNNDNDCPGVGICEYGEEACNTSVDCSSYESNICEESTCSITGGYCYTSEDCDLINDCNICLTDNTCSSDGGSCISADDCDLVNDCEFSSSDGFSTGSFMPYIGCEEMIKVSGPEAGTDETNKAWTNRMWENAPSTLAFTTDSPSGYTVDYNYGPLSTPTPAGQALFRNYYDSDGFLEYFESDSWPLPVATCKTTPEYGVGLITMPPSGTCGEYQYSYPGDMQYEYSGGSALNDGEPYWLASSYEETTTSNENLAVTGGITDASDLDGTGNSSEANANSILTLLHQLFAKVYNEVWTYDWDYSSSCPSGTTSCHGKYEEHTSSSFSDTYGSSLNGKNDISAAGDDNGVGFNEGIPTPPTIVSVGNCYGTECLEATEGAFSVNGADTDNLESGGGNYHATVQFFAWANSNQMPIRNVVVDWGDGERELDYTGYYWPLDSYSGSKDNTNYYRNHRGLAGQNMAYCGGAANGGELDEWGITTSACETVYFSFEHDYYCSDGAVDDLEDGGYLCEFMDDGTGRLKSSPCTGKTTGTDLSGTEGKCVFQPRVHVRDNWGWCTGYCTAGTSDSTVNSGEGCYGDSECNVDNCPNEDINSDCIEYYSSGIDNPWINYDGVIILDWQN